MGSVRTSSSKKVQWDSWASIAQSSINFRLSLGMANSLNAKSWSTSKFGSYWVRYRFSHPTHLWHWSGYRVQWQTLGPIYMKIILHNNLLGMTNRWCCRSDRPLHGGNLSNLVSLTRQLNGKRKTGFYEIQKVMNRWLELSRAKPACFQK